MNALFIYYIRAIIKLVSYMHFLSLFFALNAGIRKNPGNKFNPKGYNIEILKLINVSFINIIWVFLYTAQKQEIKYQKNSIKIKLKMKNNKNLIFKQFSNFFDF